MDALTIDQLTTFAAVIDEGSFAAASRRMGRAQSAVTYAIQKLEDQTGTSLFDRSSYRPRLTEAGRSLLPHARRILGDLAQFRLQARAIAAGVEAEIRLIAPDAMSPKPLIDALAMLQEHYPSVQVRITVDSFGAALRRIEDGTVDLILTFDRFDLPDWLQRKPCSTTGLIAVASPDHPLSAAEAPIPTAMLSDYLQIVLASRTEHDAGPDNGVAAVNRWYVTDYAMKRELLLAGLGWGSMPSHLIERDLNEGHLVRLTPASWDGAATLPELCFIVGIHAHRANGPATLALFEALGD